MKWEDVREAFPNRWVLIEAIEAYTNDENERILEKITPIDTYSEPSEAMKDYQDLHKENPARELYVLHTNREQPNIIEKTWSGVRRI